MKTLKKIQVILFRKNKEQIDFLLLKRNTSRGSIWQGVTGGVEDFDKSLQSAVIREIGEELSHHTTGDKIIGPISKFSFITNRKGFEGQKAIEYIYGVELPYDFKPKLSQEHSEYKWFDAKIAIKKIDFKESKEALEMIAKSFSD